MNWKSLLSPRRFGDLEDPSVSSATRSRFEQDFDRLIFSHPFRKLQDKTQVFPLPEDDFVHTRLTHSLEVSSVGRSLGKMVGERVIANDKELQNAGYTVHDFGGIVAAASLAHDLGNPPFGHSGEKAISSFFVDHPEGKFFLQLVEENEWTDLVSFEGNAQGFRILNDPMNGLKLTFATLGAFTKYPKTSAEKAEKKRKSHKKYGIYRSELTQFETIAESMGLKKVTSESWLRHPLTFLVEAADDICYHIIDLEDGCRLGLVDFETTKNLLVPIIGDRYQPDKLNEYPDENQKLGLLRALAINQLIGECVDEFIHHDAAILKGDYDQAITDTIPSSDLLATIGKLSVEKIYRSKQVLEREAGGFEVIGKLMEAYCLSAYKKVFDMDGFTPKMKSIYRLIPQKYRLQIEKEETTVYETLLIVMDFISSLTDTHAIKLYKTIYGFSLPDSKA